MTNGYMSILNKVLLYVMSPKYNEVQSFDITKETLYM